MGSRGVVDNVSNHIFNTPDFENNIFWKRKDSLPKVPNGDDSRRKLAKL